MMETKACTECRQEKPLEAFLERTKRGARVRIAKCKVCMSAKFKVWAHGKGRHIVKKHSLSDKRRIYRQKYDKTEASKASKRKYMRKLLSTPEGMLIANTRTRMRTALAAQCASKESRTMQYVGCTAAELKEHLERQFRPGMTWENRRLWHIDHIIPLVSFDLSLEEERHKAFHFSNTQPLFARENLAKSSLMPDGTRARRKVPV